ncbi:Neuronal pentraxin-2, partial [Takifugu flavidus]
MLISVVGLLYLVCGRTVQSQDATGSRFVCNAIPPGAEPGCGYGPFGSRVQSSSPIEDELRNTIIQLRETILQQKETIVSQQGTIKELNTKLTRCEAAADESPQGKPRGPGSRRKEYGKNTMGDLPRDPTETIDQLGKTMQTLKGRLENLEQQRLLLPSANLSASGVSALAPLPPELRELLRQRLGALESQLLRKVAELEEERSQLYNETAAHRQRTESTLNSLLERITELEKSNNAFKSPEDFKVSLPLRTNYLYGRIKKSLPEMYAFTVCMWLKSSASPGIGTPFSYGVPGQANEIVLIEWGNNPIELLVNDKVRNNGDAC